MTDPSEAAARVHRAYADAQVLPADEVAVAKGSLDPLADSWKDDSLPALQRRVADVALANLQQGIVDPVFSSLATALRQVKLDGFSLLDAACATGYYSEVIRAVDDRQIDYSGCDYSPAMIESARAHYPDERFSVQDLTDLAESDRSFDVVLLAGVLEHIPDYSKAIAEACRVAKLKMIVHRCPITVGPAHQHTIGAQYNIRTPRTFFSKPLLLDEIERAGFELVKEIPVYGTPSDATQGVRARRKRVETRNLSLGRETVTFVFRRGHE